MAKDDEFKKKHKKEKKHKKNKKHKDKHNKHNKHDKHDKDDKRKRSSSISSSSSVSSNISNDNNNDNKYRKIDNNNNNNNNNSNSNYNYDNEKFAINEIKETTTTTTTTTTTNDTKDITKSISLEGTTKVVTKSKLDFFSSLIANELNVPQIGTIHAKGNQLDDSKDKERNRGWICSKCETSNATYNLQCSKCRAMRRMEATHRTERWIIYKTKQ
jgi:hypothetical protein